MNSRHQSTGLAQYADVPIRLMVGFHLIIGTQDNVFSWERMLEFSSFLESFGMPMPLLSAIVSVYAQFICGILFLIGWQTKWASILMIFNFVIAILLVHIGDSYPNVFPAIVMLSGAVFLLLNGAGKWSLDYYTNKKAA